MSNREQSFKEKALEVEKWAEEAKLLNPGEKIRVEITILDICEIPGGFWNQMNEVFSGDYPLSIICRRVFQVLRENRNQPTDYCKLVNWFQDLETINRTLKQMGIPYQIVEIGGRQYKIMKVTRQPS